MAFAEEKKSHTNFSPPQQPPKDLVLFLGGSSKKHNYLRTHFAKYSTKPIECKHLYTSHCHKHGYKAYSQHFKNKNIQIVAICPLMDSLIPFTDAMNKLWHLPHNNIETSQVRRNKALMHQTIRDKTDNNIRSGTFFLIDSYLQNKQEFESKMQKHNLHYPIVIKPPTSGGTDGVRLCYTFKAAQKVVQRYLNQENGEKNTNVTMMAQEFLAGEEYVVNSVSFDSNHKFTDIWRAYKSFHVDKTNNNDEEKSEEDDKYYPYSILYDYQEFECEIVKQVKNKLIVEYVENILNILGVEYGCSHSEVMFLPKENKVCLIELNARMHGGLPRATSLLNYDQMTCLALIHCDAHKFLNEIPKYYSVKSEQEDGDIMTVRAVFLRSKVNGKMDMNKLIELKKLKTFKRFARSLFDGVNYWLEYQFQVACCKTKLDEMENVDIDGNNNGDGDGDEDEDIQDIRDLLNKSLKVIDRIEKVKQTIDLISSPGTVVLEGKLSEIKKDYETIRNLENDLQNGLFIPI